jgi:hypothetical protein
MAVIQATVDDNPIVPEELEIGETKERSGEERRDRRRSRESGNERGDIVPEFRAVSFRQASGGSEIRRPSHLDQGALSFRWEHKSPKGTWRGRGGRNSSVYETGRSNSLPMSPAKEILRHFQGEGPAISSAIDTKWSPRERRSLIPRSRLGQACRDIVGEERRFVIRFKRFHFAASRELCERQSIRHRISTPAITDLRELGILPLTPNCQFGKDESN